MDNADTPAKLSTAAAQPQPERPFWLSNPMDWQPIDRFILLASLVILAPLCFGVAIGSAMLFAPEYINMQIGKPLLVMYFIHIGLLLGFIGVAISRRREKSDWPAFENFIVGGYIVTVMLSSYLTGSHFTEGLLLLFLGVNITSTLANVDKIRFSYWFVVPTLILFGWGDFTGGLPFAPLMQKSLFNADGSPVMGWLAGQATIAGILSSLIYLCILAVRRWVERENLYKEMSTIDGLTRLTNRSSFIKRGCEELARVQRQSTTPSPALACIMLDLDHFKRINDTWGHHAGDAVLVTASQIMMDNARQYDEVGRYGGEEFAILLPGVNMKTAVNIAERLRRKISDARVRVDGHDINITASLGVACYPSAGVNDMNDLLKAADKALYEAKEGGRNQVVMAAPSEEGSTITEA